MLFNSLQFAIFFVIVFGLYCILSHRWQNRMLLAASLIFYGAWDARFLSLLAVSILLSYFCGRTIYESTETHRRKFFLILSIAGNLGILGFFKYFNFFVDSAQALLHYFGLSVSLPALHIILPIGISFYTFQALSYVLDIYKKEMKPASSLLDLALFVSFFPQLVAGPIERAQHLLPQVQTPRVIKTEKIYEGLHLIFWGLFQKIVIADNLARIVDPVFANNTGHNGADILIALYAFSFQIYCDFAGYSNIAKGLGACMGFDIMTNFYLPYFSTNPREFWQRWHISLSTFLRDYLYIPLGGNREGTLITCRNLAITMLLGGLWHGASWTFVLWGAYWGALLIIYRLLQPFLQKFALPKQSLQEKIWFILRVAFFFHITCAGWLIFRAQNTAQLFHMAQALLSPVQVSVLLQSNALKIAVFAGVVIAVETFQYLKNDLMIIYKGHYAARAAFYYVCLYLMILFGITGAKEFIYFQF